MTSTKLNAEPIPSRGFQLDTIADHTLAVRKAAAEQDETFLVHLLDMVLVELAKRGGSDSH